MEIRSSKRQDAIRMKKLIGPATSRMFRTSHIRDKIAILESLPPGSLSAYDRYAAIVAARDINKIVRNGGSVDALVNNGAVPALVKHLLRPVPHEAGVGIPYEYQVEESCASTISNILLIKIECAQLFVEHGILPLLVNLLNASTEGFSSIELKRMIAGAGTAICNLAQDDSIKTCVRDAGAIPPLVELLKSRDLKVLTSTASALQNLCYRNEGNRTQILECDALSKVVRLLDFKHANVQRPVVGIILCLVRSSELSDDIKQKVLQAGALQPVINLLRSFCSKTQSISARLIGIFAADPACRIHIAQRGAIKPLIELLSSPDPELKIDASYALAKLAQDEHNQVGIAYGGGMLPLLKNLGSKHERIQNNSALALYWLVNNEENIHEFLKLGCVTKLLKTKFNTQFAKDYVSDTIEILQEKMTGQVLADTIYLMKDNMEKKFQTSILLGLAHICSPNDLKTIFMDNNGLDIIFNLLAHGNKSQQQISSEVFLKIDDKTAVPFPTKAGPHSQSPKMSSNELSGNSDECHDVTFVVEGRSFYANKTRLLASSSAFCAIIDGGYKEKNHTHVEISNVKQNVFELMIRYIHTGHVDVISSVAHDLLAVADQYQLDDLKEICESVIAKDICFDNIWVVYKLAETCNANFLRRSSIRFILSNFKHFSTRNWFDSSLVEQGVQDLRSYFTRLLSGSSSGSAQK